jgi:hypothetical protein
MADLSKTKGGGTNRGNLFAVLGDTEGNVVSPASDSSGDTLREDDSCSDVRSDGNTLNTLSSPLSPEHLNFDSLSINNSAPRYPKGAADKYANPFLRGAKNYNDGGRFGYPTGDFGRRENNFRTGSPYGGRGGGHGYRNSHTWMSNDAQTMQDFMVVRNSMRRQFKSSEVAKWKHADYIAHREAMVASEAKKLAIKLKAKEDAASLRIPPIPLETQQNLNKWGLLGNFEEQGNTGRVLGEATIWCANWEDGKDDVAPWPSLAEMKWEGDDRAKTGVGRFLPLPREQGPPGLAWNTLECVKQYPMDQVARIPTMEDVYLPVDDQIEEDHEYLWSKDLEKAMDDLLEI